MSEKKRPFEEEIEDRTESNSYELAYRDESFLRRHELRSFRFQLELMKPEIGLNERGIDGTVAVFGSARIKPADDAEKNLAAAEAAHAADPADAAAGAELAVAKRNARNARYYEEARKLGRIIAEARSRLGGLAPTVLTGGGPGIMEAANRGATEAGGETVGLTIVLPKEEAPNPWVTPGLCFRFHYFASRKMHFLMRAEAVVAFPGGFGTLDELFETATLIQTGKMNRIPLILFGKDYWTRLINLELMVEEGMISPNDPDLFSYVETAEEAWAAIRKFWD